MDFRKIEKKWQKRWEKAGIFEADVGKREKFFITSPYPYVNLAPHVGHSYSYFRTDAYARFKRMQGFSVLYPQGWHATGEPILGVIERIRKGDRLQIETLQKAGAKPSDIRKFVKDPKYMIYFFIGKWKEAFKKGGMSIDWRRSFVTTQLTPQYSRFIEWQYNTLRKRGYVVQSTHPVIWCPHDQSPTGDHDRLEGEGESPVDYILLKFSLDDMILPAATLRPETIYGVTNLWVNPDAEYVVAQVDGEKWIVSEAAAGKLADQLKKVRIIEKIKGDTLLGKKAKDPLGQKELVILPARFVDPDNTTGVVMSVPSHAPYDWVALQEIIAAGELEFYGLSKNAVEPVSVVAVEGFGDHPAIEVSNRMGIKSAKEQDKLDEATSLVYRKEFHSGILRENCGRYAGLKVSECKEKLSVDFIEAGIADVMWETTGKVVCRCTTRNHVKILENQWFLKFSDEGWKNQVKRCLDKMDVYPPEAKANFLNTVDWLKDKACTRKGGLGTPLPWDKEWIVETLSDSTIYMAYYTVAGIINEKKVPAKKLTDEVLDYVFFGRGNPKNIAKTAKLNARLIEEMRNEFLYFYPVDMRNSGKDLIQNHLTFYIFHHVAMWPERFWPRAIGANGYVNVEGEKMSKSKGNIITLMDLLDQFGADFVRINIATSSEGIDDADWRVENIRGLRSRYEFLYGLAKDAKKAGLHGARSIDSYVISQMQRIISNTEKNYEAMRFRTAAQHALFDTTNLLKWYLKRVGGIKNASRPVIQGVLKDTASLLAPLTPHVCEELWQMLRCKGFVSVARWPDSKDVLIDLESELGEEFLKTIIEDVERIKKIAKIEKPKNITLFVAEDWKFRVYMNVLRKKDRDVNEITREIMQSESYGKATVNFIQNLYKRINELKPVLPKNSQSRILMESRGFLEKEFGCRTEITDSDKTENKKARNATPEKPGILVA